MPVIYNILIKRKSRSLINREMHFHSLKINILCFNKFPLIKHCNNNMGNNIRYLKKEITHKISVKFIACDPGEPARNASIKIASTFNDNQLVFFHLTNNFIF